LDRRRFVIGSAASAVAFAAETAEAQPIYPSRPIMFINPFPPGGAADVVGRPFAAALEPIIKQPCVIETKAGAAGQVGAQFAANARPDGYTLLIHMVSISGFAEVDKLFGRQVKFTNADFIRLRVSSPTPACSSSMINNRTGRSRISSMTPGNCPTACSSVRRDCMARCISPWRCL